MIHRSNHESVDQYLFCLGLLENKPQMNADERRFANLNIQRSSEVYLDQSSAISVTTHEKAAASRFRTRMTRIARIFTDIVNLFTSVFHPLNNKPQRARTQSRIANLHALNVIYGILTLFTAWLTRIYPYPCVSASSAQSVFYYTPSLCCIHPRLIMSLKEKISAFYYALINKVKSIFCQKSDLHDRHLLLQRT